VISTFAEAQTEIAHRVKQFQINYQAYHAPDYKEAHARQDLIDWLFIALGWDVRNDRHVEPASSRGDSRGLFSEAVYLSLHSNFRRGR